MDIRVRLALRIPDHHQSKILLGSVKRLQHEIVPVLPAPVNRGRGIEQRKFRDWIQRRLVLRRKRVVHIPALLVRHKLVNPVPVRHRESVPVRHRHPRDALPCPGVLDQTKEIVFLVYASAVQFHSIGHIRRHERHRYNQECNISVYSHHLYSRSK